jgi:hypothetical protein
LERNNFHVEEVDFGPLAKLPSLTHCQALIVAGPRVAVSPGTAARVLEYLRNNGHLLLILPPNLSETGEVAASGLESVLAAAAIESTREIVLETESELVLPVGVGGDVYLATPQSHEITRLLSSDGEVKQRVLMQMPQSFKVDSSTFARSVLVSSAGSRGIKIPGRLADPGALQAVLDEGTRGEHVLAAAAQLDPKDGAGVAPRLVVVGSLAPFVDSTLRGAAHYGSTLFVDGVMAWLAGEAVLVDIPEKAAHEATLSLTEESLGEVSRYVLLYMPGTALLLGVIILLKRRSTEKSSRQATEQKS